MSEIKTNVAYGVYLMNQKMQPNLLDTGATMYGLSWQGIAPEDQNTPIVTRESDTNNIIPVVYNEENIFLYHMATGESSIESQGVVRGDKVKVIETTPLRMTVFTKFSPEQIEESLKKAFPHFVTGYKAFFTGFDLSDSAGIIERDFPESEESDYYKSLLMKCFVLDVNYNLVRDYYTSCVSV